MFCLNKICIDNTTNGFAEIQYSGQLNEDLIFVTLSNTAAQILHIFPEEIESKPYKTIKGRHKHLDDFINQLEIYHGAGTFTFNPYESNFQYEIVMSEVESNSLLILFNKIEDTNQIANDKFSLNLFNKIFSKTIDACFLLENGGVFIGCNPSAIHIFEATTADNIVGRTPSELSPEFQECGTLSSVKAQEMMYIAKHKGNHLFEWTHLKIDKSPLLCEVSLTFLEISHYEYFLTIIRDISPEKAKEMALSESEKLYRMLAENTDDVIWLMNPRMEFTYVSPSIAQFSGYSPNEFLPLSFEKLLTIGSYEQFSVVLQNEIKKSQKKKSQSSFTLQLEHLHKDDRVIWGEININFVKDSGNNIIEILGVTRDINEQKMMEGILHFEKERYRAIIEAYDGLIYICSPDYIIEFMNEKLIDRTGFDGTGKPCFEVLHGLKDVCEWCVNDQIQEGKSAKWEVKSPKDNRWYSISNTPIFRSDGQISKQAMIQDITDSKQAEISIRESEEKFRVLSDSSPMAIFIYQGHNFKYVNSAMEEFTEYSKEELLTMNFYDFIHPDFYNIAKTRGLKRQKGINLPDRYELKIISKTGIELWVDFSGTYIEFESAGAALGTAYNITERKNAEEALRQSEEKYRMLIQNQSDLIIKINTEGCFEYVSPSYCTVFGKTENELIGNSFYPHIHEDDIGHTLDEMQKLKKPPYICNIEHRSLTINGWRWFAWSNKAIFD